MMAGSNKYREYLNNIRFHYIKPDTPILPIGFGRFTQKLKLGTKFEVFNTRFPSNGRQLKRLLQDIFYIPKMSTCAIGGLINEGVRQMPSDHAFVNVGVWKGYTLFAGMAGNDDKVCIGVDNFTEFGDPKDAFCENFERYRSLQHHFFEMGYRDYFVQEHQRPIGFYIYDGEHSYENQLNGLQVAEPFFGENCIILIDDANYDEVQQGTADFIAHSQNHYEVIFSQTTFCNAHPTFWNGIIMLQRVSSTHIK
jgi:hypothetical protein